MVRLILQDYNKESFGLPADNLGVLINHLNWIQSYEIWQNNPKT